MDALTKESHFILDLDIGFWMMSDFLSPTRQISYLQFGLNFLFLTSLPCLDFKRPAEPSEMYTA